MAVEGNCVHVGNLAYSVTEKELSGFFDKYGRPTSVTVVKDKETQEPRGFGFVTFETTQEASDAINGGNGSEIKGSPITVQYSRPRSEFRGRGRGRGGFDDRRERRGFGERSRGGGDREAYRGGRGGGGYSYNRDSRRESYDEERPRRDDYGSRGRGRGTDRYSGGDRFSSGNERFSGSSERFSGGASERYEGGGRRYSAGGERYTQEDYGGESGGDRYTDRYDDGGSYRESRYEGERRGSERYGRGGSSSRGFQSYGERSRGGGEGRFTERPRAEERPSRDRSDWYGASERGGEERRYSGGGSGGGRYEREDDSFRGRGRGGFRGRGRGRGFGGDRGGRSFGEDY